ncbi:MAG: DUF4962 domain-containing protein [Chitinophagaceae bacterium]|jgi:hypothetical protein|nr:DUF4962 domain-containing protein [Chitinophagaceae bacterium]
MFNLKQISTFFLGAAAGYGLFKYNSMSDEEKQKLKEDLKAKAEKIKEEAENMFNDVLKKKGSNDGTQPNV